MYDSGAAMELARGLVVLTSRLEGEGESDPECFLVDKATPSSCAPEELPSPACPLEKRCALVPVAESEMLAVLRAGSAREMAMPGESCSAPVSAKSRGKSPTLCDPRDDFDSPEGDPAVEPVALTCDEEVDEEVEATDELEADTVVESDCFESLALGSHSGLGL